MASFTSASISTFEAARAGAAANRKRTAASSGRVIRVMGVSSGACPVGRGGGRKSGEGGARPLRGIGAGPFLGIQELDVADARGAAGHALDRLHQAQEQVEARPRAAGGIGLG